MWKAFFLAIMAVCFFAPRPVLAWGRDGHRIVCAIAWNEIRPASQTNIERLLSIHGQDAFADICNWADEYRDSGGHQETAPWHFVDVPAGAKQVDLPSDCPEPKSCAVRQIERNVQTLRSEGTKEEKAAALKFLIHLVADLHQPLHVSRWRDEGGTLIRGTFLDRPTNMHSVWDFGLIRSTRLPWQQFADDIERQVTPKQRRAWARSRPLDWANESLSIANEPSTGYVNKPFDLGESYAKRELPIVYKRLAQASVRLAALLDETLEH